MNKPAQLTTHAVILPQPFPEFGLVRIPQILDVLPISPATWWRWVKSGKAPQGIKLSPQITTWRAEDVRALIDQLAAEQEG